MLALPDTASAASSADAAAPRAHALAPKADEHIDVPAHGFAVGSTPGDEGRDPTTELPLVTMSVPAFGIDALPYPNDPGRPPRTNVAHTEAEKLCADRGARLCTELEWEAACRGPQGDGFASGATWDASCEKDPATCASGYGVRGMGALREWTASTIPAAGELVASPAIRGGGGTTKGAHRCARRARLDAKDAHGAPDLAFRCCRGAAPPDAIPAIEGKPAFRKAPLGAVQIAKILASVPELVRIGPDVALFDANDTAYLTRSKEPHEGIAFTTTPLLWSPEPGAELLVLTGRNKAMSFVVALWVVGEDKYRIGSYFYMLGDAAPIALAYRPHEATLYWTTCWQCSGEMGKVSLREDHHVVIIQE
jgi:hypothetical protein